MTIDIVEDAKKYKSKNLRYKKAVLNSLTYDDIREEIYSIQSECEDARYYFSESEEFQELDPDIQEEVELLFAELSASGYQLYQCLDNGDAPEYFDDCVVHMLGERYKVLGYDSYEEDYYHLTSFSSELAGKECYKRLMRLTKDELLTLYRQVTGILVSYFHVRYLYDYLKASTDIFNTETKAFLEVISEINKAYDEAEKAEFYQYATETKAFEKKLNDLPLKVWLS
ncbi:MAG: hypothetical protein ACYCWE_21050 [Eubacteriales bacterium]